MQPHNLFNLVKSNICFEGSGSYIDLILTNQKFCFKNTSTFETGLSDHHHLIHSMLRANFKNDDSKHLIYRDYKNLKNDLKNELWKWSKNYE